MKEYEIGVVYSFSNEWATRTVQAESEWEARALVENQMADEGKAYCHIFTYAINENKEPEGYYVQNEPGSMQILVGVPSEELYITIFAANGKTHVRLADEKEGRTVNLVLGKPGSTQKT